MATAPNATTGDSKIKFKKISMPEIDGWYDVETQGSFVGRICGYKTYQDDEGATRHVVLATLMGSCKAKLKGGKIVDLKSGQTLGVGLKKNLMPLLEYVDSRPVIRVKALAKLPTGNGQNVWTFDVEVDEEAERNAPPPTGDEIPF